MALVVEFSGLPGAGKTSLHGELKHALESTGASVLTANSPPVRPKSLLAKLTLQVCTAATSWRALLLAARVLRRSKRRMKDKAAAFRFVFVTLQRYRSSRDLDASDVLLLDEGIVQRCFMLFVEDTGVEPVELRPFLASCPAPGAVVEVVAAPRDAISRLENRARGLPARLVNVESTDLVVLFEAASELFERVTEELQHTGRTASYRVNASDPDGISNIASQLNAQQPCRARRVTSTRLLSGD